MMMDVATLISMQLETMSSIDAAGHINTINDFIPISASKEDVVVLKNLLTKLKAISSQQRDGEDKDIIDDEEDDEMDLDDFLDNPEDDDEEQ